MTTIQDRIEKINFEYKKKFPNTMMLVVSENEQHHKDIEIEKEVLEFWNNKLIQSIKEVEEETRKEIINHIDFFADQSRWFVDEDNGVGPIIQTRVISVEDLQKELLSITNKDKQK